MLLDIERERSSSSRLILGPDKPIFLENGDRSLILNPGGKVDLCLRFSPTEFPIKGLDYEQARQRVRQIFENGWFSVRSRIAVYAGDIYKIGEVETLENGELKVRLLFSNYSNNILEIHEGDPLLRVFIPSEPLKGKALYQAVRSVNGASILFFTKSGEEISPAKISKLWRHRPLDPELLDLFDSKSEGALAGVRFILDDAKGRPSFDGNRILRMGDLPKSGEEIIWGELPINESMHLRETNTVKNAALGVGFVIQIEPNEEEKLSHGHSIYIDPHWAPLGADFRGHRIIAEFYGRRENGRLAVPNYFDAFVYEVEEV